MNRGYSRATELAPTLSDHDLTPETEGIQGDFMDKAVITIKGQVVIPSKLRRKFGIKKGTQVSLFERDGEIIIKSITDEYIRSMA